MNNTISSIVCDHCGSVYEGQIKNRKNTFCSRPCKNAFFTKSVTVECGHCQKPVTKKYKEFKKAKSNVFCNSSCAASFNNTLRRKSKRSKVEIMLFESLQATFPHLDIIANDKLLLQGMELDIAIPSLKIGIEWNGIVHFQPIYGDAKLNLIQQKDAEKQLKAKQLGIHLIVIPDLVSTKTFVEKIAVDIKSLISQFSMAS